MDNAGNQNTCIIEVIKQVEYRSKSCTTCNTCGGGSYWSWDKNGNSYCSLDETKKVDNDNKIECSINYGKCGSGQDKYWCQKYTKKWHTKSGSASCDTCGCGTWGEFGEWQKDAITENSSLTVETREVFTQK